MINLLHDGKTGVELWFEHLRNNHNVPYATVAHMVVHTPNQDIIELEDQAVCHYRDNFSKETGRKLALARLFKNNEFMLNRHISKEDRRLLWKIAVPTKVH